jgi:uncharacterized OB-fold protein
VTGGPVTGGPVTGSPAAKPEPTPTATTRPFWDGLRDRKVMLQYSPSTDAWVFYPRVLAPGSLADDLQWREVSGDGQVYSYTVTRRPTAPPWAADVPQIIAVVELAEGPRLTTELVNVGDDAVRVGMAVRPVFCDSGSGGPTLLRFEPAAARRATRRSRHDGHE